MPKIFPIYLFTGDDDYLKKEAVQKLKKALLDEDGGKAFNFDVYEIKKCDIKEVINTLRSIPFASPMRLVLLKDIDAAAGYVQDVILDYATSPSKKACLVLESSKIELSGEFYGKISKYVREVSFVAPKGSSIAGWIQKEVKTKGKAIHYNATLLLRELKGDDVASLKCEIDKLITYIGKRQCILQEDVEGIVGKSAARSVFEFVKALSRKDAKEALAIAKELYRIKKPIPEILGMVGWQFRKIKKAQGFNGRGSSGKKAGIQWDTPPFYIQRFKREIKSFTAEELDRNIDYLLDADYSIKKGYLKPEEALELLIVRVCSKK